MVYLRGSSDSQISKIAEDMIESGFNSVVLPALPPTLELGRETVGNIAEVTREIGDNLFELRNSIR